MSTDLTPLEHDRLAAYEEVIRAGLETFIDVGSALAGIRKERLYRKDHGGGFDTFEEYCKSKWSMTHRRANQLIEAAEIAGSLGNMFPTPTSDRHARSLGPLPPDQRADAWREATETAPGGRVTAAHVQSVVDRRTGKGEAETTTEYVDMSTGEVLDDVQVVKTTTKRVTRDDPAHAEAREKMRLEKVMSPSFRVAYEKLREEMEAARDEGWNNTTIEAARAAMECLNGLLY
jgi:hypothetical protein